VALLPLYLQIQQDLQLASIEKATLLVTIMFGAYFIPSYPMGVMADRFSKKKLLALGLLINGAGFVALSFSPSYAWAIVSIIIAGFGGSFYHPAATALVARLFPEARGKALGWAGVGASFGFFLGPLYCGWRAVATASWRAPICEIGVIGCVVAGLFYFLADDDTTDASHETARAPERAAEVPSLVGLVRSEPLFGTGSLWALFLGASFALSLRDFTGSAMGTSASLFLQNAHHYSPKAAGLALSWIFVASAISNPLFGRLSDRGRTGWATFLLITAAMLVAAFPRVPLPWKGPVLLTYGLFFMATYPITEAALMEAVPDRIRGRVFGLFITIGGLVGNLSHWAVGEWVHRLGPRAAQPNSYLPLYTTLTLMLLTGILGLPCLKALKQREGLAGEHEKPHLTDLMEPAATP